jgi:hypothetical protein
MQKGRTEQDLTNYFDMKTRYAKEYALELLEKLKKEEKEEAERHNWLVRVLDFTCTLGVVFYDRGDRAAHQNPNLQANVF